MGLLLLKLFHSSCLDKHTSPIHHELCAGGRLSFKISPGPRLRQCKIRLTMGDLRRFLRVRNERWPTLVLLRWIVHRPRIHGYASHLSTLSKNVASSIIAMTNRLIHSNRRHLPHPCLQKGSRSTPPQAQTPYHPLHRLIDLASPTISAFSQLARTHCHDNLAGGPSASC